MWKSSVPYATLLVLGKSLAFGSARRGTNGKAPMPEAVAVTLYPSHGHFGAFGYGVTAASFLWTNSSHTLCAQVFHGGLPQQNGWVPCNTILSLMSSRGSGNEGHWVSGGRTQSWTSLHKYGS